MVVALLIMNAYYFFPHLDLRKSSRRYAALYTPFRISPRGGEKVLFTVLLSYQQLGYRCLLFLEQANVCQTVTCIRATAEKLQVEGIDWNRVTVILGAHRQSHVATMYHVDAYYEIGNSKFPRNHAIGKRHNIYHCQFPFDLDKPSSRELLEKLASFDLVHVSSKFVHEWYMRYTLPEIIRYEGSGWKLPSVRVVPSPIGGKQLEAVTATSMKLLDDKEGMESGE